MKEIKILGTGCAGCKALYAMVEKVVRENGLSVNIVKEEDIMQILQYNTMSLPAVVIDEQVVATGRLNEAEVKKLLGV